MFTCNDIFSRSRDALALLDNGGREELSSLGLREELNRLEEASAERSESEGRDMEPDVVCFAGLLMSRFMSRWPLASRSRPMPDVLCGLVAVNDREG